MATVELRSLGPTQARVESPPRPAPAAVPLSVVKISSVLSARPDAARCLRSRATFSSMLAIIP
ncbi:MAG: hypothetical protein Ct9H300mP1_19050 [Planctomycetaceae bacterium]|nr:MAG: hypothetical protein Ct9H300mP1_19050 [Planctomycetaceae bacterium]